MNHLTTSKFSLASIFVLVSLLASLQLGYGQVAINTTGSAPDVSAMLDISSTSKGILIPRMTLAQRPASPSSCGIVLPGFLHGVGRSQGGNVRLLEPDLDGPGLT